MFTDPYYYKSYSDWLNSPDIFERESSSGFIKVLNSLDRDIVAAEVGVAFGTNMFHMMEKVPRITKYYAVDQWDEYKDYADDCPWGHMDVKMMQSVGETFLDKLNSPDNKNTNKVVLIKKPSETGHHFIENDSLDWIFIDANHSHKSVYQDCMNYWPKVKKGGVFSGHDWFTDDRGVNTVRNGIYQFCDEMGIDKNSIISMRDDPDHHKNEGCWMIWK